MDNLNNDLSNDIMLRLCVYDNTPHKGPTTKAGKIIMAITIAIIGILMILTTLYCTGCFD